VNILTGASSCCAFLPPYVPKEYTFSAKSTAFLAPVKISTSPSQRKCFFLMHQKPTLSRQKAQLSSHQSKSPLCPHKLSVFLATYPLAVYRLKSRRLAKINDFIAPWLAKAYTFSAKSTAFLAPVKISNLPPAKSPLRPHKLSVFLLMYQRSIYYMKGGKALSVCEFTSSTA